MLKYGMEKRQNTEYNKAITRNERVPKYGIAFVLREPEAKSYFHGIKDKELKFALYY
jgi:hypothetical protein